MLEPYWQPLAAHLCCGPDGPLPPFLLADRATFLQLETPAAAPAEMLWEFPLIGSTTLGRARTLGPRLERIQAEFGNPGSPLGAGFLHGSTGLPSLLDQVERTTAQLTGPVGTVGWSGTALTLAVMALAGVFAVRRRRTEYVILRARGATSLGLALRSAAEAFVPAVLGAAVGVVVAVLLVRLLGPSPVIERAAVRSAVGSTALATVAGLAVLGIVCAIGPPAETGRAAPDRGRLRAVITRVPWEAVVLSLAAAALLEIRTHGTGPVLGTTATPTVGGAGQGIDRMVLLFPALFLAGLAGLAVRGLRRGLAGLRVGRGTRPATFLALRRLAAAPRSATALVGASATAFGILVYGSVLTASVQASAAAEARVFVGSDVAVSLAPDTPVPRLPNGTLVQRISSVTVVPGERDVDLLAVDPATFARAVTWERDFSRTSLPDLLRSIGGAPATGGELPVIAVGSSLGPRSVVSMLGYSFPVREAGSATEFPGAIPGRDLLVVDTDALTRALRAAGVGLTDVGGGPQVWIRGDPNAALATLRRAGVPVAPILEAGAEISPVSTVPSIERTPAFLALTWSLRLLQILGILAGVLALFGLLLYLQARQRGREVAYALAVRMGLSKRDHRRSVVAELAGLLGSAFALGSALAVVAAVLVHAHIAEIPGPLGARLAIPARALLLSAAVLVVASFAGAWAVQRRAERTNVAEAMRLAG